MLMKKFVLLLMALTGTLKVHADNFSYLTFETTEGEKVSVPIDESMSLSISGTSLTVGSKTFILSNLSKMYFTDADETATDIREVTSATLDEATNIYDLQGHKVQKDKMRKGVYIVETKERTYKIMVK